MVRKLSSTQEFLPESLSHQTEDQPIDLVCLEVDSVFIDEYASWRARESAYGHLHLVILEEFLRLFNGSQAVVFDKAF